MKKILIASLVFTGKAGLCSTAFGAIDGKTMYNAIDDKGRQTHIMSAIGHASKQCYTQKKLVLCR